MRFAARRRYDEYGASIKCRASDMDRRSFLSKAIGSEGWELQTRLAPDECAARVRQQVSWPLLGATFLANSADPLGAVNGDEFRVYWARRQNMPQARGKFVWESGGTRIDVRLGLQAGSIVA